MLKKVLPLTVLAASALSTMATHAAAPGIYVAGQLGYANTHMNSKTDMGDEKRSLNLDSPNLANDGLAGRVALGYQFSPNFAVEMGYMQLKTGKSKGANDEFIPSDAAGVDTRITTLSTSLKQNLIDLVGKGIVPVSDKLNAYGKLGVAYLTSTITGDFNIYSSKAGNQHVAINNDDYAIAKHKLAPEVAIGISYDISPNVSVDSSWTHIQPLGKNRPGNVDFAAVGLAYNFG